MLSITLLSVLFLSFPDLDSNTAFSVTQRLRTQLILGGPGGPVYVFTVIIHYTRSASHMLPGICSTNKVLFMLSYQKDIFLEVLNPWLVVDHDCEQISTSLVNFIMNLYFRIATFLMFFGPPKSKPLIPILSAFVFHHILGKKLIFTTLTQLNFLKNLAPHMVVMNKH